MMQSQKKKRMAKEHHWKSAVKTPDDPETSSRCFMKKPRSPDIEIDEAIAYVHLWFICCRRGGQQKHITMQFWMSPISKHRV